MTTFVLERLAASAQEDPFAWYPATGWMTNNGPKGLALELFGETPSSRQLNQLAWVLSRLGWDGAIEAAVFRKVERRGSFPSRPHTQGRQAIGMLHSAGSRSLDVPNNAYGVRLATTA